MVFGWFDSTLSTKYLLTKTEKLMENEKQFVMIYKNILFVINETRGYINFKKEYDKLTILGKMEVNRLLKTAQKPYWANLYKRLISEPENEILSKEALISENKKIHEEYIKWYETIQKPLEEKKNKKNEIEAKCYLFIIVPSIIIAIAWFAFIPLLKIVGKIWFVGFEAMTNTNVTGGKEIISTHGQSSDFDFILGFILSIMLIVSTIFLFIKKK